MKCLNQSHIRYSPDPQIKIKKFPESLNLDIGVGIF